MGLLVWIFSSTSTDMWCNNYKKHPVFQGVLWSIGVSGYKHWVNVIFAMKCSVFGSEIRWQGAKFIFTSFSLRPVCKRNQTGVFFLPPPQSPPVLPSRPTSCSTSPLFHLNSLSSLGHNYDSSVCHIKDARQTDSQRVRLYLRRVNHNLVLDVSSKIRQSVLSAPLLPRQLAVHLITNSLL